MQTPTSPKVGLTLAAIQLFFTLSWTVYVIFLPQLAAQVGIAKEAVLLILLMDQLIFLVADTAMGVVADKSVRVFGRLGRWVVIATVLSCAAFLLLPLVAAQGPGVQWLFLACTVVWSVTSSALRAPPLVLLGKYAKVSSIPWLASLSFFGLGVAGALAPYLTVTLRGVDPRWPFALSSIALALATFGIVWAERSLKQGAVAVTPTVEAASDALLKKPPVLPFLAAMALLGVGFQVHFSLNTAPLYLRFAQPAQLEYLMPVFWVGFSLLMLAASRPVARFGGVWVMAIAACVGAWATWLTTVAGSLPLLVAAQFVAGGAWGILMMSAFTSALVIGRTGREGLVTGSMFSLLALAAFARIGIVAAQLNKDASLVPLIAWLPTVAWVVAGLVLLAMARLLRGQRSTDSA
ncbi:MAG: MFS transporter [Polaromonas sp.]|uniref:MFS transporter n=1 Tax=Polaromonas sp. TaxID=1869339 RepID=UPI0025EDD7A5|nr:MFS transporter [Polaromonas sp.]MBI2724820.1 MFS transporter [Polaromonas sp.]